MNTSGLKIVCRDLYAENADPERHPLTTRFDEVDAALIFDDVIVPWDRLFVYKNPELLSGIMSIHLWAQYSTMARMIIKLEGFLGVAQLLTEWGGRNKSAASQILLSSLMQDIEILRSCMQIAAASSYRSPGGTWAPRLSPAYRIYSIEASDRAERTMEGLLTSTLMVSGGASDLHNAEIGPLIERYFRGGAPSTKEHLRLLAGLSPPTAGTIRLAGQTVSGMVSDLMLVFQDYGRSLLPWRNARKNVALALERV